MKSIVITGEIKTSNGDSTVGRELADLLEVMPTEDAKTSVRHIMIADELNEAIKQGQDTFQFEDADLSHIEYVLDMGARKFSAKIIAPIKRAVDAAKTFKATVKPPEEVEEKASQ